MPTQQFWNQIIDTKWRWMWKRKNLWYDNWKNLWLLVDINELRLAVKRSEERLNRAVPALCQRRLPSQQRIKEEEVRGDEIIPPPEASGAADLSASSLAPTSVVRRSLRQHHQAWLSSSMPYWGLILDNFSSSSCPLYHQIFIYALCDSQQTENLSLFVQWSI